MANHEIMLYYFAFQLKSIKMGNDIWFKRKTVINIKILKPKDKISKNYLINKKWYLEAHKIF